MAAIIDAQDTDFEAFDSRGVIVATATFDFDGNGWRVQGVPGRSAVAATKQTAVDIAVEWGAKSFIFGNGMR